jgi:AraC family transcriptional regulator
VADFDARPLAITGTVAVWDAVCPGARAGRSDEECATGTHLVFPYRGAYVHHVGREQAVAEPNQVIVINAGQPYQVSHPVAGGDAALSVGLSPEALVELTPPDRLRGRDDPALNVARLRLDADAQALTALLRHGLAAGAMDPLEAEGVTLALARAALGGSDAGPAVGRPHARRLVDRAKLVVAADLGRRWTLADIGAEVGASPVYLTQIFADLEGMPLSRYQLRLRLARALALLGEYDDLAELALALGFSSHSHFSTAFKQAYGQSPSAFRLKNLKARPVGAG